MSDKEKLHERFIRWDAIRRNYFSVIINLFLTISIGLLSFLLQELGKSDFTKNCLYTFGLISIAISVVTGILTSTSRFFDFRYTARKIRLIEKNSSQNKIDCAHKKMKCCEKLTSILFYFQTATFILSIIFNALFVLTQYKDKLF